MVGKEAKELAEPVMVWEEVKGDEEEVDKGAEAIMGNKDG